ncbi:hypothetical protein Lser_V15G41222 [Lactuca serriola]
MDSQKITEDIYFVPGDVHKDGYLSYGEFVPTFVHLKRLLSFFDKNKSDYIEEEKLREALVDEIETHNEEIIVVIILDVHTRKDGHISYEEFEAMMKAEIDWKKASGQYSRERYNNLSLKFFKEGFLNVDYEEHRNLIFLLQFTLSAAEFSVASLKIPTQLKLKHKNLVFNKKPTINSMNFCFSYLFLIALEYSGYVYHYM